MKKKPAKKQASPLSSRISGKLAIVVIVAWVGVSVLTGFLATTYLRANESIDADVNGIFYAVHKVDYDYKGSAPFVAPEGWKYVIVNITVRNDRQQSFDFAPVVQTSVSDNSGAIYEMSPTILEDPIVAGPLNVGASTTGSLSYLVPQKVAGLRFNFDPSK